ncbi:MAG TPA: hypothetical protein VM553_17135 [Dongiaceae bacterium]|nr:hypothetical protein [Dongiaceae bacterium]
MGIAHSKGLIPTMLSDNKKPAKSKLKDQTRQDSSETIAEQTKAFLKAGGQVVKINAGVSGKPFIPTKNR